MPGQLILRPCILPSSLVTDNKEAKDISLTHWCCWFSFNSIILSRNKIFECDRANKVHTSVSPLAINWTSFSMERTFQNIIIFANINYTWLIMLIIIFWLPIELSISNSLTWSTYRILSTTRKLWHVLDIRKLWIRIE